MRGIGSNEHIKELLLTSDLHTVVRKDELEAFCGGLSCNKSIQRLDIQCCGIFGGEINNMLTPFFQQNSNLHCLAVDGFGSSLNSVRLLSEVLSRFSTFREFKCPDCYLGGNDLEALLRALTGHSKLTTIN